MPDIGVDLLRGLTATLLAVLAWLAVRALLKLEAIDRRTVELATQMQTIAPEIRVMRSRIHELGNIVTRHDTMLEDDGPHPHRRRSDGPI